ncbi:MAG: DUF2442 domain-containing protein [Acidobacteriaceae bacterium]|jgi:hypothetical protein
MDRHPNDLTTDEEIDEAIERAKLIENEPRILEAVYRPEPGLEFLMLRLSDGRRLLIPKEDLSELKNATPEQAVDLKIGLHGVDIWWPQLDDGLYLPDFLEYRWGKEKRGEAA